MYSISSHIYLHKHIVKKEEEEERERERDHACIPKDNVKRIFGQFCVFVIWDILGDAKMVI